MDVQKILDAATAASVTTLGAGHASELFKSAYNGSAKCRINLKQSDKDYLARTTSFSIVFTREITVTHDHSLTCAMRALIRECHRDCFDASLTTLTTLVVGAASREIKAYNANPNVKYWVHGSESKDFERVVKGAYESICTALKKKVRRTDRKVFLAAQDPVIPNAVKTYVKAKQIFADYCKANVIPPCIFKKPQQAHVLVFEDTIYNYDGPALIDLFTTTGALIAFGYALLPNELAFPEMPTNDQYHFRRHMVDHVEHATLTFRNGYSNGYTHRYEAWATLFRSPVITGPAFSLVVEITARVGSMASFKIMRGSPGEHIARSICLPAHDEYLRVLDVYASVNTRTMQFHRPFAYISIREEIVMDVMLYMSALDIKSVSLVNCLTYIRRRVGGMSLVSKELVAPWDLPRTHVTPLAVAITAYTLIHHEKSNEVVKRMATQDVLSKLRDWIASAARVVFYPITLLTELLMAEEFTDKLIVTPEHRSEIFQMATVPKPTVSDPPGFSMPLNPVFPYAEDIPDCDVCHMTKGKLGAQVMSCRHKQYNAEFALTTEQLDNLFSRLADDDADPEGIRKVKAAAKTTLPKTGFTYKCPVYFIDAGPGCGKSYLIRAIANPETDGIIAPFSKLMVDYKNVKQTDEEGKTTNIDFYFKTTHRAMQMTGADYIYVDEWTSFDYSILACIVNRNQPKAVFLVGDDKQTRISEPSEGLYIGNYIPMNECSHHELHVNFRNQPPVVAWLNKKFGYSMVPHKLKEYMKIPEADMPPAFEVVGVNKINEPQYDPQPAMGFSYSRAAAETYYADNTRTARSCQGSTWDNVRVTIVEEDKDLPAVTALTIVAMSRARLRTIIVTDYSETAKKHLEMLGLMPASEEFPSSVDWNRSDIFLPCIPSLPDTKTPAMVTPPHLAEILRGEDESGYSTPADEASDEDEQMPLSRRTSNAYEKEVKDALLDDKLENASLDDMMSLGDRLMAAMIAPPPAPQVVVNKDGVQRKIYGPGIITAGINTAGCDVPKDVVPAMRNWSSDSAFASRKRYTRSMPGPSRHGLIPTMNVHAETRFLVHGPANALQPMIDKEARQEFIDHMQTHGAFPGLDVRPDVPYNKDTPGCEMHMEHPCHDVYLLAQTLVPQAAMEDTITSLNFAGSMAVQPTMRAAKSSADKLVGADVNLRHHPVNREVKYRAVGPGFGSHFSAKNPLQELSVMTQRYVNPKPVLPFDDDARALIDEALDLYFAECKISNMPGKLWEKLDEAFLEKIAKEFVRAASTKNYDKQFWGFDYTDARTVRLHLKQIFKPETTAKIYNEMKAGQGISAWSPDALSMFCFMFRAIQALDAATNRKDETVYILNEHGMSVPNFLHEATTAIQRISQLPADIGMTDGIMFDSNQNQATQYLETGYIKRLGFAEISTTHYYSFRHHYRIEAGVASGQGEFEKTSGEPGTLLNNESVDKVYSNHVLRGKGPMVVANKGDDYLKIQMCLAEDKERSARWKKYVTLNLRCMIGKEGEFCGFTVNSQGLTPNLHRRANKIIGARFRNYEHFTEYQKSLRDFTKMVGVIGVNNAIVGTMLNSKCTRVEAETCYQFIDSVSHIDRNQWFSMTKEFSEEPWRPVADDNLPHGIRFEL